MGVLTTSDALFSGAVPLAQPKDGYRFNIDSVHLAQFFAEFATPSSRDRVCDLGAGVGVVGLSLLHLKAANHVTFVERDARMAALASKNVESNERARACEVVCESVTTFDPDARFDAVVMNPPYFAKGRVSPKAAKRDARSAPLRSFAEAARRILAPRGSVFLVYTAGDLANLVAELRAAHLEPKLIRFVHSKRSNPARIVLVKAQVAKPGGLVIASPLFEDTP